MLKQSSLERKEFKHEELALLKKLDFNDIEMIKSDNLGQLLIWTSELAEYHHAQFVEFSHKLNIVDQIEEREEINKKITFYRKSRISENHIKDFYLKKLLDQGDATVKGYIKHPIKQDTNYAVISYQGYHFVSFATPEIIEKFPLHFIDFVQSEAPKTLADIHPDEALLLLTVQNFIRPFKEQYKKIKSKNKEIKEHNTVVYKIYIKIKKKEATLQKPTGSKPQESSPKPIEKSAVPVKMKQVTIQQNIASQEKPITVIKKRKFALIKDK
ncbi:hypothetical protein M0O54_19620 [Acinetobacter lactucae]|uniref:Uncharacterized protein n=1 Tax=Acinetobacter lactucae TaxID=1785128 RepID=A0AB35K715_9GAMM|nr:hypothetical protein [Acinetobacter lactucae]MDD9322281.1 hypothetical protein [Acinetobacter lactucae]